MGLSESSIHAWTSSNYPRSKPKQGQHTLPWPWSVVHDPWVLQRGCSSSPLMNRFVQENCHQVDAVLKGFADPEPENYTSSETTKARMLGFKVVGLRTLSFRALALICRLRSCFSVFGLWIC